MDTLKAQLVHKVCGGSSHSMALTGACEVFTWGSNDHGQLGRSKVNEELRRIPKWVEQISCFLPSVKQFKEELNQKSFTGLTDTEIRLRVEFFKKVLFLNSDSFGYKSTVESHKNHD